MERVPKHIEILIPAEKIQELVRGLASKISEDYKGKNLLLVGILKGSFVFMADLMRELDLDDLEIDFMKVASYGAKEESSREPKIESDLSTNPEGRHLLIVEDIVDTGYSFKSLLEILIARHPASLKTCALLSKPERREVDVPIDYLGTSIENKYVVGYGLDADQKERYYPFIGVRK